MNIDNKKTDPSQSERLESSRENDQGADMEDIAAPARTQANLPSPGMQSVVTVKDIAVRPSPSYHKFAKNTKQQAPPAACECIVLRKL